MAEPSEKLLILGGTAEARALAHALVAAHPQLDIITSLAGATDTAGRDVPGTVRIGGFGGVAGLKAYLRSEGIAWVMDATHPFAAQITANALSACQDTGVAYLRLERPQWVLPADCDVVFVPDAEEAARLVARTSRAALLTIGRKDLEAFRNIGRVKLLIRAITEPDPAERIPGAAYVIGRPPFAQEDEIALMRAHQIDTLVSKDSGGEATRAKLDAAAAVGARIVLLRRPAPPKAARVSNVDAALAWLAERL